MSKIDDGGPIYPVQEWNSDGTPATLTLGMSLRDWFAGQELQRVQYDELMVNDAARHYSRVAEHCYKMADAMIATRGKP